MSHHPALRPITGRPFYIIITDHSGGAFVPERNVVDLDRASTVADIAGAQHTDILQILECNLAAATCRDVTREIAAEVCNFWDDGSEFLPQWQQDIVDLAKGKPAAPALRISPAAFDRSMSDYDRTLAVLAEEIGA